MEENHGSNLNARRCTPVIINCRVLWHLYAEVTSCKSSHVGRNYVGDMQRGDLLTANGKCSW